MLHEATSVKKDFEWKQEIQKVFENLKKKLKTPPELTLPELDSRLW